MPSRGKDISISDLVIKEEDFVDMSYEDDIKPNINLVNNLVNNIITHEEIPADVEAEIEEVIEKKELDLDSIDMMQLPIQLDDHLDLLADVKYAYNYIIYFSLLTAFQI